MKETDKACGAIACTPTEGLRYIYRLGYSEDGYPYIEVVAEDGNGVRCERSGLFPRDGVLARAFLALVVRCEVSPHTLVEVYDEFLTHHPL